MEQTKPTPAQSYMRRLIDALDGLMENPDNEDWYAEVQMMVLERPRTLRSALNAALYKSLSAQSARHQPMRCDL